MRVDVSMKERVLVLIDGKPQKYLGPGRYRMLIVPWRKVEVKRLDTDALVATCARRSWPWFRRRNLRVIALGPYERALVTRRGKPARWLGAGVQQMLDVDRPRVTALRRSASRSSTSRESRRRRCATR